MLAYVHICAHMLMHGSICEPMLAHRNTCCQHMKPLSPLADTICWNMVADSRIRWHMLAFGKICHHVRMISYASTCWGNGRVWQYMLTDGRVWKDMAVVPWVFLHPASSSHKCGNAEAGGKRKAEGRRPKAGGPKVQMERPGCGCGRGWPPPPPFSKVQKKQRNCK